MYLVLYMEYKWRMSHLGMDERAIPYKLWLDIVLNESEMTGQSVEALCAPPDWQYDHDHTNPHVH